MKKIYILFIIIMTLLLISTQNLVYASSHTAGEVISEADSFIQKGEQNASQVISQEDLKGLSDTIYNILLVIGIIAAVIVGALLGLKFITEGVEGKAEVQKSLIAYVIGCVVIFGSFLIWKIVVTVLQGL